MCPINVNCIQFADSSWKLSIRINIIEKAVTDVQHEIAILCFYWWNISLCTPLAEKAFNWNLDNYQVAVSSLIKIISLPISLITLIPNNILFPIHMHSSCPIHLTVQHKTTVTKKYFRKVLEIMAVLFSLTHTYEKQG